MRAVRAGPVLRGQCFANEQILRGPALAARKGPVQACLQGILHRHVCAGYCSVHEIRTFIFESAVLL